jgi:hypothetical protein
MRVTFGNFDSGRSYSIVALQQGRVQTDSDTNEAQQISKNSKRFSLGIAAYRDGFETTKPHDRFYFCYHDPQLWR